MSRLTTMRDWCAIADPRRWYPPRPLVLCGRVYGHPCQPDGAVVTTTPLVAVAGRPVTTASGTRDWLETAAPAYVARLSALGLPFDAEAPLQLPEADR